MKFEIDIKIKKIEKDHGQVIIYCDKPRALGEIIRHNHGFSKFGIHVWSRGITLMEGDFQLIRNVFKGFEITVATTQGSI